jgi:hypothetical protein
MGIRSDHQAGRTWVFRGDTPVVRDTGKRFKCNLISAITNRGQLNFMIFTGKFTTEVFLNFLQRLAKQNKHKRIVSIHGVKLFQNIAI